MPNPGDIAIKIDVDDVNFQKALKKYQLGIMKKSEKNKAYRHGAKIIVPVAKNEAPKSTKRAWKTQFNHYTKKKGAHKITRTHKPGELRRSIGITTSKSKFGGMLVGPRWGKGRANDGYYGVFVEKGTGKQNANPFMDRAYKKTARRVRRRVVQYFEMNFEKYKRKNGH